MWTVMTPLCMTNDPFLPEQEQPELCKLLPTRLQAQDPDQHEQNPTNYIFLCKIAANTPIDVSKIIFKPLITLYLIADTGAMTTIGVRKCCSGNAKQ